MVSSIIKQLERDIKKNKETLLAKAKKSGITENFGEKEMRNLRDKYFWPTIEDYIVREKVRAMLQDFDNWCMDFNMSYLEGGING